VDQAAANAQHTGDKSDANAERNTGGEVIREEERIALPVRDLPHNLAASVGARHDPGLRPNDQKRRHREQDNGKNNIEQRARQKARRSEPAIALGSPPSQTHSRRGNPASLPNVGNVPESALKNTADNMLVISSAVHPGRAGAAAAQGRSAPGADHRAAGADQYAE
jgi:hypothetical protein